MKTAVEKFENRITKSSDGCWIWNGPSGKNGYGQYRWKGKNSLPHRVSFLIFKGNIKKNRCVCHSCDNRMCVNPKHLWLGSYKQNMQDAKTKGRIRKGSKIPWAILNEKIVREIRKIKGKTFAELGRKYGVSYRAISMAIKGETWSHV